MGSDIPVSDKRNERVKRNRRVRMHVCCERKLSRSVTTRNMESDTDAVADIAD